MRNLSPFLIHSQDTDLVPPHGLGDPSRSFFFFFFLGGWGGQKFRLFPFFFDCSSLCDLFAAGECITMCPIIPLCEIFSPRRSLFFFFSPRPRKPNLKKSRRPFFLACRYFPVFFLCRTFSYPLIMEGFGKSLLLSHRIIPFSNRLSPFPSAPPPACSFFFLCELSISIHLARNWRARKHRNVPGLCLFEFPFFFLPRPLRPALCPSLLLGRVALRLFSTIP